MKKVIRILFILVIFISIFVACAKQSQPSMPRLNQTSTNKGYFIEPDKIIIYKNGDMQTINKENNLFPGIVSQMNGRIDSSISIAKLAFDKNSMNTTKQKEIVVEFLYSKSHKLKFGSIEKKFNSLIFPLTGQNKELCFFEENKNHYSGPIGPLKNSDALLNLLK